MKKKKFSLIVYIEKKLSKVNHSLSLVNKKTALKISLELAIIAIVSLCYCYYFFHGIWYLNTLVFVSAGIILYSYLSIRIELLNNKFKNDIPKMIRKLRYYLLHTKNISKALEKTYDKAPKLTRGYIKELQDAVDSLNIRENIALLKAGTTFEWLKMLCDLVYYCKLNGDKDQAISKSLNKVTNIIEFVNIEQGKDNAELFIVQIGLILLPLIGIPFINQFNASIYISLEQTDLYAVQATNILAAKILLFSNIANLFVSWIRKNS